MVFIYPEGFKRVQYNWDTEIEGSCSSKLHLKYYLSVILKRVRVFFCLSTKDTKDSEHTGLSGDI